jgi:hypothetical protein
MSAAWFSVKSDWHKLAGELDDVGRRQLPFATARALTDTVKLAQKDFKAALPSIFDRPTPFTINSTYVRPATKADLTASIELKDFASKGTPARKYLGPQVIGGGRNVKRFERRLDYAGHTDGAQLFPVRGAEIDQYGNVSRAQIVRILSRLKAFGDTAQNVGDKTTRRLARKGLLVKHQGVGASDYFIARSKADGHPLGIYRLVSKGKVQPVMIFARHAPRYRPRLDFVGFMTARFARNFGPLLQQRLREAIATARPI